MFVASACSIKCVFGNPNTRGGVWVLPDFATHKVTNLLRWRVEPVVFDAIGSEHVAGGPLEIRERTDRDRSRFDLQRLWVELELLLKENHR